MEEEAALRSISPPRTVLHVPLEVMTLLVVLSLEVPNNVTDAQEDFVWLEHPTLDNE